MKKKHYIAILSTLGCLLLGSISIYLSTSYKPLEEAYTYLKSDEKVEVKETKKFIKFSGLANDLDSAIIFYQGAKVEEKSYAYLGYELASEGIDVLIIKSFANIAFFNMQSAYKLKDEVNSNNIYLMGHSLGGVISAYNLNKHPNDFKGLILLASYSTYDLSSLDTKCLLVRGENDKVLNLNKYQECLTNLPSSYVEELIPDGNHALFGMYGKQKGDGDSSLGKKQLEITKNYMIDFIK